MRDLLVNIGAGIVVVGVVIAFGWSVALLIDYGPRYPLLATIAAILFYGTIVGVVMHVAERLDT